MFEKLSSLTLARLAHQRNGRDKSWHPGTSRRLIVLAILIATISNVSFTSFAQQVETTASLAQRITTCFDQGRPHAAIALINQYLNRRPNDPNMLYNKACAHALIGERDRAAESLHASVEAGFNQFDHMRRDPDLASIHDHPMYKAIADAAIAIEKNGATRVINRWRSRFGEDGYQYEIDEARHLCYATALDKVSHAEMREMIEKEADQLIATLFESGPGYYVLVAVPTPEHAEELLKSDMRVGGVYDHNQRVLVTRNIGGSLRHEFFHLMHYGHMERINQDHPLWMQEGMASLYEDYELTEDGKIVFIPNERHNVVRNLAKSSRLMRWSKLFSIEQDRFMADATQLYPQVRSIFEFVADRGLLPQWYKTYVREYENDRTGVKAFEEVFAMSIDDVERQWRMWVAGRPPVDTVLGPGDAVLGILSRPHAANDGVYIEEIIPQSSAETGNLRVGDVIVAIGGKSTRSLLELQSIIAAREVGDVVEVRARRGDQYVTSEITLRAMGRSQRRR